MVGPSLPAIPPPKTFTALAKILMIIILKLRNLLTR
jgi:hypothetical protein